LALADFKDCTEREIKAVDSEHKKNLQNDMWRFFQMEKHVFREDHPYHKFGTGNYETLWSKPKADGRDPRQQLIEWWKKYYCARRMKLAVNGKEDVETLEKWVRERFERVEVRSEGSPPVGVEGVRIAFDESPMGPEQMGVSGPGDRLRKELMDRSLRSLGLSRTIEDWRLHSLSPTLRTCSSLSRPTTSRISSDTRARARY
jgi:hypothetical protein